MNTKKKNFLDSKIKQKKKRKGPEIFWSKVKVMKMKYNLGGFEMKFGAGEKFDGAMKIDNLEVELGIPAMKEIAALIINTQKELAAQCNENAARDLALQERKFNEEIRRNRRIFQPNKKESQ